MKTQIVRKSNSSLLKTAFLVVAVLFTAFAGSSATNIRERLISIWPLDAMQGNTMPDAAFTNAMTVVGSPTIDVGRYGNAMTFGTGIYLTNMHPSTSFSSSGLPIYAAGTYSICMWVKGAPQSGKYLFTEASMNSRTPLFLLQTGTGGNTAKFDVYIRTDAGTAIANHLLSSSVILDNTWHHIAWVDENGDAKLYVDGQLDANSLKYTRGGTFTFHTTSIGVLARTNTAASPPVAPENPFTGQIDDVGIWERALSQEEVQSVMNNGIPTDPMAPVFAAEPVTQTRRFQDWALFSTRALARRAESDFTYQWFKNGSPIDGATMRTYQTQPLTPANSGEFYAVEVTNSAGSILSSNAYLTVLPDPAVNVQSGLMNYWPLDMVNNEGGSLLTPDLYSHAHIALTNQMSELNLVPGRIGQALSFDGLTNIAYRTSGSAISVNPSYSVSMWVQGDFQLQNDKRVFSEGTTANNPLMTIGTQSLGADGSVAIMVRPDTGGALLNSRPSTAVGFDNNWHHIVWTDDNGQGRLYIDGVLDLTDYTYTPAPRAATITSLGGVMRSGTGNFFYGQIDEVAAWNRAITWSEVQDIYANGIPVPVAEIPPAFTVQPIDRTNNTWVGQNVSFSALVSGTSPSLRWYKDGQPISLAVNPSADTPMLSLTNIQLSDNGDYWLNASNSMGMTNSTTVKLLAQTWVPTAAGEVLKIDVGLDGAPLIQPGFDEFTLGVNGTSYGVVSVTVSPVGGINLGARNRLVDSSLRVADSPPRLTHASIYNDFIFASTGTEGLGMRVLIEQLAPNTPYGLTLWCYDRNSTGAARVSNWYETSSGSDIPVALNYTFSGSAAPTNNYQYTMGGLFTSSASGKLQFEGRVVSGGNAVFFNGLRLVASPGGTSMRFLGLVDGNLMAEVVADYQGQPITIQESSTLVPASWTSAVSANPVLTNGPAVIYQLPVASSGAKFYRAASQPPQ